MITGQQIRSARERAGLTQEQLAQRVDVSLRSVGNWERGHSIPRSKSAIVEAVLADWLDKESDEPQLGSASDAELLAEIARRFARAKRNNERDGPIYPTGKSDSPTP